MTALVGLATRLALAKVALHVPGGTQDVETLAPIIDAGVDLLLLGGTGDVDADVETLRTIRNRYGATPLLLGTSSKTVAAPGSADVVHLARPGWRFWGYPKGHQWSLLGRHADHSAIVRDPGEDFDYLFVGPLMDLDGDVIRAAVKTQPPLTPRALPWFALGNFDVDDAEACLTAGARRIALTGEVLERDDAVEVVRRVAEAVTRAWEADENSEAFRFEAFRF